MGTTTVNTRPETKIEEDELQLELTARVVLCCWSYGEKKKKKMDEGGRGQGQSQQRARNTAPTDALRDGRGETTSQPPRSDTMRFSRRSSCTDTALDAERQLLYTC